MHWIIYNPILLIGTGRGLDPVVSELAASRGRGLGLAGVILIRLHAPGRDRGNGPGNAREN